MERNDKKIIECRYNRKGNCKKGKQCEYKHTQDEENPGNKDNEEKNNKEIVCKYYKTGNCMKGERCEYKHTREEMTQKTEAKNEVEGMQKNLHSLKERIQMQTQTMMNEMDKLNAQMKKIQEMRGN